VVLNAPVVTRLPARVMVKPVLATPVPPPLPGRGVVKADARFAPEGVASHVPTPVPNPVRPPTAIAVAVIVPLPEAPSDAPVPTTIAAVVLVDPVRALNAVDPPDPQALPVPLSTPVLDACTH